MGAREDTIIVFWLIKIALPTAQQRVILVTTSLPEMRQPVAYKKRKKMEETTTAIAAAADGFTEGWFIVTKADFEKHFKKAASGQRQDDRVDD